MSVAKGRPQFVIVDRPAALGGRPVDKRGTSFVGETAAFQLASGSSANTNYVQVARRSTPTGEREASTRLVNPSRQAVPYWRELLKRCDAKAFPCQRPS